MLLQKQRMATAVNDLHSAVRLTRSEAIKRGRSVTLAPAADGNRWENGWMIFIHEEQNDPSGPKEEIIFLHSPVPEGIEITSNFGSGTVQSLAYDATGRPETVGSFVFRQDGRLQKAIRINFLGRPRSCDPSTDRTGCLLSEEAAS